MKTLLVLILIITLSSCQKTKAYDLKSPCVSSKSGPCIKRPVNTWLANNYA